MNEFDTGVGKQPLGILFAGYGAVVLVLVLTLVLSPTGINAWVPYLLFWVVSVLAYVAPFTLFYLANGKVERESKSLKYDRKAVNFARFGLLIVGLVSSTTISLFLATEISKTLNAGG